MHVASVALIGMGSFFTDTLPDILDRSHFSVIQLGEAPEGPVIMPDEGYDLVIIQAGFASMWGEEIFFDFIQSLRGFLLVDSTPATLPCRIHESMRPEEILSMIGNVIYRDSGRTGIPKRKSSRLMINMPVKYEYGDREFESVITTLSANGLFINTLAPLVPGSRISLTFTLPGQTSPIVAIGKVLYIIEYDLDRGIIHQMTHAGLQKKPLIAMPGMAVLLEGIDASHRQALKEFVENNSY